ncbi:hypothetical protein GIB67_013991 [Kingdonia uniflora]|uniref:Annexin n=1 Tax=Kingdonia uniflora TaxID=39325 RepID=A0A7J7LDN2_9MAGN|nr:hypothetical protein GIB67_013991 [Kingdonia uniflora]
MGDLRPHSTSLETDTTTTSLSSFLASRFRFQTPTTMSTLTLPSSAPSVAEDCEQLKKAFDGWGTNEKLIISILAHRTASQLKLIRQTYTETYGEDLLKALDKELSSDFEKVVLLWTLDPADRDALLANEATRKWTASNGVLLEIACTRTSHELFLVRQAYHARFKKSLEEDVASHTTGDFRKIVQYYMSCYIILFHLFQALSVMSDSSTQLLVPLVSSFRYEGDDVNMRLAKSESKMLRDHITDKAYNHEEFIRILTTRSKAQLNATFNHYNNDYGNAITKDLKCDPKDEFLALVRAIVKSITYPEKYFEKVLRLAINKTGTDEGALTRVITTRAEVDMKQIKEEYHRRNSVPLDRAIVRDTSSDYEAMLLALIGHEDA